MSLPEARRRAVVWDLDGTLVDSAPDLAAALNTVLGRHGFEGHSVADVRSMIGNGVGKLVERGFDAAGISPLPAEAGSLVDEFMEIYSVNATVRTRPYPLILGALKQVGQAGYCQGICTNKPEAVTRRIVADLGLDRYIGFIVGGDTTAGRKPDPRPLSACLEGLGASPAYAIMVGDSATDVGAARELQMPVGVVSWGYSKMPAHYLGADFVARHPGDLPGLIRAAADQQARKTGTA